MIFMLNDALRSEGELQRMLQRARRSPDGPQAISQRMRLPAVESETLSRCENGTFGQAYAKYVYELGLAPSMMPSMRDDTELAYVEAHLSDAHDFWHIVTGFGVDLDGETGLQAFSFAQIPSRLAAALVIGSLANAILFNPRGFRGRWAATRRGWRMGRRARPLFGIDWTSWLNVRLKDVREAMSIESD
jgi:ubiquinone biosynthesis protein COQ4